ncbi:MAG: invasion associated locus B family protein [Paracoccaceae bacterium]
MTSWMTRGRMGCLMVAGLALAGTALTGTAGFAQESTNQVAVKTDWSVFAEDNPKECWGVSPPKETVNSRDGKPVSVKRSDILLFVTFRPGQAGGETSFTGGYPFAGKSTVTLDVGGTKFEMTTDGEWAWAASVDDDARILAALQKGTDATLSAHSAKGTQTKDTFSLRGFTAAMAEAAGRCK